MMTSRFSAYYLKKAFALWPGVVAPVAAGFLGDHYRRRGADRSAPRKLLDAAIGVGFRAWVPLRAKAVARKYGFGAEWTRRATAIARARFADPNDVALFRIEEPGQLDSYLRRFENAPISKRINPAGWRDGCVLADKIAFYERCRAHGIPHPRVLAILRDGVAEVIDLPGAQSMAFKMFDGEGGDGFRFLDWPQWQGGDAGAFKAWLERGQGATKGVWIVQERVANHPDMLPITLNAVATVRTTTLRDETGRPEIVTSVLRFASRTESLVDNIKAGGLIAPVSPDGVLGAACQGRGVGEYATHPVTGVTIAGFQIPYWEEAKALVARAHETGFGEYNLVGWDVAITPDGPILIEGNAKPCMIVAQRAIRKGVGATRFGELLRFHLARAAGE